MDTLLVRTLWLLLDSLDVRILREFVNDRSRYPLQSDVRQSLTAVAEALKVDRKTVSHRIHNLGESGFLKGWFVFLNPRLFDLRVAQARGDVPQPVRPKMKEDMIRKIRLVQGVWMVVDHFGSSFRAVMYFEDEASLRKQIELIARVSNCDNLMHCEIHFPSCAVQLSEEDLALVKSIQTDPTKPYDEIAKEIGISNKTVKRRLERMLGGRALFTIPSLEPRALTGGFLAELLVIGESSEAVLCAKGAIASHVDECLISSQLGDPEHMLFLLLMTRASQVREVLGWVRERPGVKDAFLDPVENRIEQYDAFGQQLKRKLTQVRRAAGERLHPESELREWQPQGNVRR